MSNPNPQTLALTAWGAESVQVTMSPPQSVAGDTFQLNVRDAAGSVKLAVTTFAVVDATRGVFTFGLASSDTGATLGVGDYTYDVWRTTVGRERRLCYGPCPVASEQWK